MEIKITTRQVLIVLQILCWLIFIGLCVEAGGILFNTVFTLTVNPLAAKNFWMHADISALYAFDKGYFMKEAVLMSIVAVMKAILFYLIIKIFHERKINLSHPFNMEMKRFISNMAYLALGIGLFAGWGIRHTNWLVEKGVAMPDVHRLRLGGADVWLLMGVTLLVVAHIFKKGIEIQSENDLTV